MSLFLSMCQILVTKTEGIYFILQSIDKAKPQRRKHDEPSEYPELELMTPGFVHEPLKHTFILSKSSCVWTAGLAKSCLARKHQVP